MYASKTVKYAPPPPPTPPLLPMLQMGNEGENEEEWQNEEKKTTHMSGGISKSVHLI